MYCNTTICPVCGNKQIYKVKDRKHNDKMEGNFSDSIILSVNNDIFTVESDIKCNECRNVFRVIDDINFDLT